jgi:hypothetical protein
MYSSNQRVLLSYQKRSTFRRMRCLLVMKSTALEDRHMDLISFAFFILEVRWRKGKEVSQSMCYNSCTCRSIAKYVSEFCLAMKLCPNLFISSTQVARFSARGRWVQVVEVIVGQLRSQSIVRVKICALTALRVHITRGPHLFGGLN